ncbi:hypothetical protein CFI10_01515 [Marinobacterium iners]|nr:hypothetical protein CFI10_01515 [Marinobacterium iners]
MLRAKACRAIGGLFYFSATEAGSEPMHGYPVEEVQSQGDRFFTLVVWSAQPVLAIVLLMDDREYRADQCSTAAFST